MADALPDHVLRRLLMVKQLLVGIPQLTSTSDGLLVARAILTAHDAADLALATIVGHRLPGPRKAKSFLMDYAAELNELSRLYGFEQLGHLSRQRDAFKHHGTLPHVPDWHTVGERIRGYIEAWCSDYLDTRLADVELDALIENETARSLYQLAKVSCATGDYQDALEQLGKGLYLVLHRLSAAGRHADLALRLVAFGVNAGDFLTLQQFLPSVSFEPERGDLVVTWDTRGTGHRGNWSERNVRFCLGVFVDVVVKIQHATRSPWPVPFYAVYIDTATAKHDGATVWRQPGLLEFGRQWEPVKVTKKGEVLRGLLLPIPDSRQRTDPTTILATPPFRRSDSVPHHRRRWHFGNDFNRRFRDHHRTEGRGLGP